MCLLVVASQLIPGEPLIVGANRDEVLDRPTTPITVLGEGPPRILGGRDELSGGTWLAVNERGVCAGLTNQPLGDAKDPTKRSRGELPLAAARCPTAAAGVEALARYDPAEFNGAWLLVGDRLSLYFVDFTGTHVVVAELGPGIHVLENRAVDDPSPKSDLVRDVVASPASGDQMVEAFERVLRDHRVPEGDERPNAATCVHLDTFGTRSSCLVRVGSDPGARPRLWVADGPPCTSSYVSADGLWGSGSGLGTGSGGA